MENKKYELDKVLIDINSNSDNKDNSMSTYLCNYAKILEAFINDINNLKIRENFNNGSKLEEFDIIDKFKKLVISEADRCVILNRPSSPISNTKSIKENIVKGNIVSDNTPDLDEITNKIIENIKNKKIYGEIDNSIDSNKSSDKNADNNNKVINNEMDKICEEINNIYKKNDNNETKQKVNEPIKPKTIKPKEDYNNINKVTLSSVYGTCRNSDILDEFDINNKEEDPINDFEFVAEAFARLISKFNKGDI